MGTKEEQSALWERFTPGIDHRRSLIEVPIKSRADPSSHSETLLHVPCATTLVLCPAQRDLRAGERVCREEQAEALVGPRHRQRFNGHVDDFWDASHERLLQEVATRVIKNPRAVKTVWSDAENLIWHDLPYP